MKHIVHVREHSFAVDEPIANGGEDQGITAHDTFDSALGTCKAMVRKQEAHSGGGHSRVR